MTPYQMALEGLRRQMIDNGCGHPWRGMWLDALRAYSSSDEHNAECDKVAGLLRKLSPEEVRLLRAFVFNPLD